MPQPLNHEVWTPAELLERLEHRDRFFVLDVRNRDEFERFRLEGRGPLPAFQHSLFRDARTG